MCSFNWLLFSFLLMIASLVGVAIYFLPTVDDKSPLIVLIGIGAMMLLGGIQDLFS